MTANAPVAGPSGGWRVQVSGARATITLSRPDRRNAVTLGMLHELAAIGSALRGDVRVVLLRAEGPSFCAGLDRELLAQLGTTAGRAASGHETGSHSDTLLDEEGIAALQDAVTWLHRPDLITIAAVQGHAVGAGFQLALACDLRVLADDARFAMREVTYGLIPDLGGTEALTRLAGYARALEACVTGRWIDAAEAVRCGLATTVVPASDLQRAAGMLAGAVLAAPREAVIEVKALLTGAGSRTRPAQLAAEAQAQARQLRLLRGDS